MRSTIIRKGLDLPINGEPEQSIDEKKWTSRVALLGDDYVGMKPALSVSVGEYVKLGQLLFTDRKSPLIKYTSPGSGKVIEINRGEKRRFLSIIIALEGSDEVTFDTFPEAKLGTLSRDKVVEQLVNSGLWTALRTRPFSKVPDPETIPHSIFITAIDTNPLAPSIEKIIDNKERDFGNGLNVISKLTEGTVYLCKNSGLKVQAPKLDKLSLEEFSGPHPAGNVGTHIHFLNPVSRKKTVWHIGVQDVIAIGKLFTTGRISVERIISLAGPLVKKPRLIVTRLGASLEDLTKDELSDEEERIISGSVLSGRASAENVSCLGRYHQQISVIAEGRSRVFMGWLNPGVNLFSLKNVVLSKLFPGKKFDFNTSLYGGLRAIVPIGNYEKVMPLDILPTFLLRALMVDDIEEAEKLGCLELDEEDLALCTFACPSKIDYGPVLRRNLTLIEKEG